MKTTYYYQFVAGTCIHSWYGGDDRKAKRISARWLRRFWYQFVYHTAHKYPGSLAAATNSAWYSDAEFELSRASTCSAIIIQPSTAVILESFPITEQSIAEYARVFARR